MWRKCGERRWCSCIGCSFAAKEIASFVVFINEEVRSDFVLGVVVRKMYRMRCATVAHIPKYPSMKEVMPLVIRMMDS